MDKVDLCLQLVSAFSFDIDDSRLQSVSVETIRGRYHSQSDMQIQERERTMYCVPRIVWSPVSNIHCTSLVRDWTVLCRIGGVSGCGI